MLAAQLPHHAQASTTTRAAEISALERRITKIEAASKLTRQRYEDMFDIFQKAGTVLGVLLTVLTLWGFFREYRQHRDYREERRFYEERAMKLETRQEVSAGQEARRMGQQLELGQSVVASSSAMFAEQVKNMTQLGGVIDLVRQSFEQQVERGKAETELVTKFKKTTELVEGLTADFEKRYDEGVAGTLANFRDTKAMSWPHVSKDQQNHALGARLMFQNIPDFVLRAKEQVDPGKYAKVKQLLGTSAFYANDVDAALRDLGEANRVFGTMHDLGEYRYACAYAKHFLGVAQKNWRSEDKSIDETVQGAEHQLRGALKIFGVDDNRFLTAVTLAEVLSYREETRHEARSALDALIAEIRVRLKAKPDANQQALLLRSYLLLGNLESMAKAKAKAIKWYEEVQNAAPANAYAALSIAWEERSTDPKRWRDGLALLLEAKATSKPDTPTRVSGLAWAVIAATKAGDADARKTHTAALQQERANNRVAGRTPLFFSPTTKCQVEFDALLAELDRVSAETPSPAG